MTDGPGSAGNHERIHVEVARLLAEVELDPHLGQVIENRWVDAIFDPRRHHPGRVDLVVTIFPMVGGSSALEGLSLALVPEDAALPARLLSLGEGGQVIVADVDGGPHRLHLVTSRSRAGRPAAPVGRLEAAAASDSGFGFRQVADATRTLTATLTDLPDGCRLEVSSTDGRLHGTVVAVALLVDEPEDPGASSDLLVALTPVSGGVGGSVRIPSRANLASAPAALAPGGAADEWIPAIATSVAAAEYPADVRAWGAVAAGYRVSRVVEAAIHAALSERS